MLDKIKQSNFGEHNLILYEDYVTLNNILLEYCKTALESLNEMVLFLPHNESVSNIFHGLKNIDLDVQKYKLQGSLVIVEAKKGYFSLTNELVDIMIMIKMLLQRSNKLGKSGLTVFSDMGLFFNHNRIDDLIKHETRLFLSLSSPMYSNKMKIFCYYNITDFERLTENQKQGLLNNHSRTWQNPDMTLSSVDIQPGRKTAMDLIQESVHTSDDVDIGDIEAISKEMIVVKRGIKNIHYYYIPLSEVEGSDRNIVWLTVMEKEVKDKYESNKKPSPSEYFIKGQEYDDINNKYAEDYFPEITIIPSKTP